MSPMSPRALWRACLLGVGLVQTVPCGAAHPARRGRVRLPLAPALWRGPLRDGSQLPDDRLALAILAERRAALLYRGLAAFDDETLAALAADPDTLRRLERRHAGVLAAFGARFAVRGAVVVVPGGPEAEPLWQELVGGAPRR